MNRIDNYIQGDEKKNKRNKNEELSKNIAWYTFRLVHSLLFMDNKVVNSLSKLITSKIDKRTNCSPMTKKKLLFNKT